MLDVLLIFNILYICIMYTIMLCTILTKTFPFRAKRALITRDNSNGVLCPGSENRVSKQSCINTGLHDLTAC